MFRIIRFLMILFVSCVAVTNVNAQVAKKKVAVYVTGDDVENSVKKILGAKLVTAITSSGEFAAVERTADFLAALTKESDYQTSGEVRDSQIAKLGQKFGVRYVIVADVSEAFDEFFVASRLINVETGLVENAYDASGAIENMQQVLTLSKEVASGLLEGMSDAITMSSGVKTGKINGYEYIDLGLPSGLKWATCNVGASSPEKTGKFYSWSETAPFTPKEITTVEKRYEYNISGNSAYDAATANWGASWRTPKKYEWEELVANCQFVPAVMGGIQGVKVVGPNRNFIFLPIGGSMWFSKLEAGYGKGDYWTADPTIDNQKAYCVYVMSDGNQAGTQITSMDKIIAGLTVRPVSD